MRFYLDSARTDEIGQAAMLPFAAGVTTNPGLLAAAGLDGPEPVLEAAAAAGRRDWKLWVQLPEAPFREIVARAAALEARMSELAGSPLGGPTLVHKLLPTPECLFAASALIRRGLEVCITGIANATQAMAVCTLPLVTGWTEWRPETEGPPNSRNPAVPHFIAYYVGRVSDRGADGPARLAGISRAFAACGIRPRILAASVRNREVLHDILAHVGESNRTAVDVTLPMPVLLDLLDDPVTAEALEQLRTRGPT